MSLIPQFFSASTKTVAENSLEKGYLRYPGICLIEDEQVLLWVNEQNQLKYIAGYQQITNVDYHNGTLSFWSGDQILYSVETAIDPETTQTVIDTIIKKLDLKSYAKSDYVIQLLESKIGDLGTSQNVVDYLNSFSYDALINLPVKNLYGSLTNPIIIVDLEDGVYRVSGQFQIGGSCQTVQNVYNGAFFIVFHDLDTAHTTITQLSGNTIRIDTIEATGEYTSDKYITEKWVRGQDFITSNEVKEYVRSLITETIMETIDQTLDERLDVALDKKISGINSNDITSLF